MVLPITSFLTTPSSGGPKRPAFNSVPFSGQSGPSQLWNHNFNYRKFWDWFKCRPELIGVISNPITDIIGDRPKFTAPDGGPLGRNKLIRAKKFWRDNRVKKSLKACLFDMFVTGDGYGWIGSLSAEDRANLAKEFSDLFSKKYGLKESETAKLMMKAAQDEELKKPKKFDYIAASTVQIRASRTEIIQYIQNVNGHITKFTPEEVIHFKYLDINGEIQGFSPVESLSAEITLLGFIKHNMLAYAQNGGIPSKMFVLPEELANSDNHQFLVQTLQRYNAVQARNGNLVFTGKVEVNDLIGSPRDMEYKDLALYIASNIAFVYGIPVTRIPYLIGSSANGGDSGGLSEVGYWNMISEMQDQIEDLMNSQLFERLGFHVLLNRKYKQDEIREAQAASMNSDTVQKLQGIYRGVGKKIIPRKLNEMLGLSDSDLEEMSEEEANPMMGTMLRNQNLLDNDSTDKEPDNRKRADTKRNVANDNANKGMTV